MMVTVLRNKNSRILWQSFDSPTNTLLPGQVLVQSQKLYSKAKGSSNYSTGNFMLEMQSDGNLVLSAYHFSDPGYWTTQTFAEFLSLVFDESASLHLVNGTMDEFRPITKNISKTTITEQLLNIMAISNSIFTIKEMAVDGKGCGELVMTLAS